MFFLILATKINFKMINSVLNNIPQYNTLKLFLEFPYDLLDIPYDFTIIFNYYEIKI